MEGGELLKNAHMDSGDITTLRLCSPDRRNGIANLGYRFQRYASFRGLAFG